MEPEPYLRGADFGYENIEGKCGMCGAFVVINRATDLSNARWAHEMRLKCPDCQQEIEIRGETGSHPVDMFWIEESYVLYLQRRYMQAAIVLGQAVELALSLCAANVFIHEPIRRDPSASADDTKELRESFEKRILSFPLGVLRRFLAHVAVAGNWPATVQEATVAVSRAKRDLPERDPTPLAVSGIADVGLRDAVVVLLSSSVIELRNAVAHRMYRPNQQEIETMRDEVGRVIKLTMTAFGVTPGGGQLIVGPPAG